MVIMHGKMGLALVTCLAVLGLGSVGCSAQPATPSYPTKAIELIVAFSPGGASDLSARLIAGYLSKKWGQPINVVNLPGAGGITGTKRVLDSTPDGYTMLSDNHALSSMQGAANLKLPFAWDERTMVARVSTEPIFYLVKEDASWKSLKEVMDYAKSKPGNLKWASAGVSAIGSFAMALLFQASGVNLKDTNQALFDSGPPALAAVAGGFADIAAQQPTEMSGLVQAKKIRPLAVAMPQRHKEYPDVPTLKEAGYDFEIGGWQGISGPPKLPSYVVQKWADGVRDAARDEQVVAEAAKTNKIMSYLGPADLTKHVREEYNRYLSVAEIMGIRK